MTLESEALKALAPFPLVEAAAAVLMLAVGGAAILRGLREKKPAANGNGVPAWTLYGPVGDVMRVIHEMAEQSREGNKTLGRIEETVKDIAKEQREGTMLLENIRNNQEMRGDLTIPPPAPRRKSI